LHAQNECWREEEDPGESGYGSGEGSPDSGQDQNKMEPATRIRQGEADRLRAEAEALKGKARIEDLNVWELENIKTTKKGSRLRQPVLSLLDGHMSDNILSVMLGFNPNAITKLREQLLPMG
jgi:hypothetical protein